MTFIWTSKSLRLLYARHKATNIKKSPTSDLVSLWLWFDFQQKDSNTEYECFIKQNHFLQTGEKYNKEDLFHFAAAYQSKLSNTTLLDSILTAWKFLEHRFELN